MLKTSLAGASVIGRDHSVVHKNNQDSFMMGSIENPRLNVHWGVVCDGCGEGKRSEMGAHLASMVVNERIRSYLLALGRPDTSEEQRERLIWTVEAALRDLVHVQERFLDMLSPSTPVQKQYAFDHLLCTVVGFVILEEQAIIFNAGDGTYIANDEVVEIDAGNQPRYPLYTVFSTDEQANVLPPYESRIFNLNEVRRLAVSTDGFKVNLYDQAFASSDSSNSLKRWMNIQQKNGKFSDDATLVTATVTETEE